MARKKHSNRAWRTLFAVYGLVLLGTAMPVAPALGREPAEIVYDKVSPAVVSLRNAEGSGTGVVLDRSGLILTNAHVIMSPLPFEATLDVRFAGKVKPATFKNVSVLGIHPKYDLALVKVDPTEHRGAVLLPASLSKEQIRPGRSVYAIGNPGGGDAGITLTKTITSGMLSGLRGIDGLQYLQVSAAINPGNSGGPLCDAKGNVIGIVTFKFTDVEGIGFAIPAQAFNLKEFVPWQKRVANRERTDEMVKIGSKYLEEARKRYHANKDDPRIYILRAIALRAYWQALMHSPGDATLFYNVGMIYRTLDEEELALPYLVRSVELKPWGAGRGDEFREIGYALVKLKRMDEAMVAYQEGITKYPSKAGKVYEDLAITYINRGELIEAAVAAKSAIMCGDSRTNVMNSVYSQATGRMSSTQMEALQKRVLLIRADWHKAEDEAKLARAAKKEFVTKAFEQLIEKLGTLAKLDNVADQLTKIDQEAGTGKPGLPEVTTTTPAPAPADPDAKWIEKQLDLARLYESAKNTDKVKSILQSVVNRFPDHAKTKRAKDWLKRLGD